MASGLSQQTTQYLSTYGKASATTSRFQILGDGRVMYPLQASGSMYDGSWAPHKLESGGTLIKNMIARGSALYAFGAPQDPGVGTLAVRLGVSTPSGGNVCANNVNYAFVHSTQRLDAGVHFTYMCGGEAVLQNTNGPNFGASIEQFTTNVGGTVTAAASGTTLTGAGTTFTTAALTASYAYVPSLNAISAGDLIKIIDGTNTYWHRIKLVTSDTVLQVYPALVGSGTAGRSYQIWRSGYGSYSRVVPIYNSNTGGTAPQSFFNYYAGLNKSVAFPGTIQCFTREASGAAVSQHFTCPQNSAAQDIKAVDVAYYKQFLLYGYGGAISWSVAGFPTSFTTGFGGTDFPAGNVSVVAADDQFISFEMLGDQLVAFFKNSAWQVQATGSVPEFSFYRLPMTVGPSLPPTSDVQTGFFTHQRSTVSTRNYVFYYSDRGLMQYASGTFDSVAAPILRDMNVDELGLGYSLGFDPETNTVVMWTYSDVSQKGFFYNIPEQSWSQMRGSGVGVLTPGMSGVYNFANNGSSLMFYNPTTETINTWDGGAGAPLTNAAGGAFYGWKWSSVVAAVGDQYAGFQPTGIQIDGNVQSTAIWSLLGGKTPYNLITLASGTVQTQDNRILLSGKFDMPFLQVQLQDTNWGYVVGANLYADGLGK